MAFRDGLGPALCMILLAVGWSSSARAEDSAEQDDAPRLVFHGFVSQGYLQSTHNNYLARSKRGSFEFTEAALNLSGRLDPSLRVAMQLFTRDLGPIGNYKANLDWFFLDWRRLDQLGLRLGRVKLPFGLFNDSSDYDPARVQILLPQSTYPLTSRDFLLAVTGGEAYGSVNAGAVGELEYRLYGGTLFIDPAESTVPDAELDVPYVVGGRVMWEAPVPGLRLGGSALALRLDADLELMDLPVTARVPAILWVGSVDLILERWRLSAEYGRWHVRVDSDNQEALPSSRTVSERYYLAGSYVVNRWLQTGLYYSGLFRDVAQRRGRERYQHDIAGTVRFDLTRHWLVKVEAHYLAGTGALSPRLNDAPLQELPPRWGLLLVKTTAYF